MTCQSGPLMGSATAPARQPLAYEPIERAARGAGAVTAPNSSRAGGCLGGGGFLAAGLAAGFVDPGVVAAVFAGPLVTCSAATAPQHSISTRLKISLRIRPRPAPRTPKKTLAQMMAAIRTGTSFRMRVAG